MVASPARLHSGDMSIDFNQLGYLWGLAHFYGYDTHGYQMSWLAYLYDFHLAAHGVMIINIYGQTGFPLLGYLSVTRLPNGDLVGNIAFGRSQYVIRWH